MLPSCACASCAEERLAGPARCYKDVATHSCFDTPRRLLEDDEGKPLEKQSTYRLLRTWFGSGWKLKLLAHKEVAENMAVRAGPIRTNNICVRHKSLDKPISQPYLVCLRVLGDGGFRRWLRSKDIGFLRHGQTGKACKQLIEKDDTSAMAFELDVGNANHRHRQHAWSGRPVLPGTKGKFRVAQKPFTWGCISFKYHKPPKHKEDVEGAGSRRRNSLRLPNEGLD